MKIRFAISPAAAGSQSGDLGPMLDSLESSGFDGIWLSDVALSPVADPIVGLGVAAGRTTRIRLGANVVPLGRNPYLLAKALAQLDQLSAGRVLLSFVPGIGERTERAALGVEGTDRGALLEEALGLVRRWWAGEQVTQRSTSWSFDALELPARPVQEPLEVWLGGSGPKALERAGRVSDGWLGALLAPSEARDARAAIERSAEASGRSIDPEHFGMSIAYAREPPDEALLAAVRRRRLGRDPSEVVPVGATSLESLLGGYVDEGLSKFVLRPLTVSSWIEEIEWLSDAVLDMQT